MIDMPRWLPSANAIGNFRQSAQTSDRQNLVAASIADRLYSKPCYRVQKTSGTNGERSTKYILPGLLDSMGLFRFTQESSNGWSKSRGTG